MSHLSQPVPEKSQELSLATCGCGSSECSNLVIAVRNPAIQPNPERPEELMCVITLPLDRIPGMVAAAMQHYAEFMPPEDGH